MVLLKISKQTDFYHMTLLLKNINIISPKYLFFCLYNIDEYFQNYYYIKKLLEQQQNNTKINN